MRLFGFTLSGREGFSLRDNLAYGSVRRSGADVVAIPENQLKVWSQPGTCKGAKNTHSAIRNALDRHRWPESVRYRTYLQCSYRNNTHLRCQSDVDVVVELTSLPVRDGSLLPDSQASTLIWPHFLYSN